MKRLFYLCFFTVILIVSCKKDKFPDEFSVYGRWKENIADSNRTEIEFRRNNELKLRLINDTIRDYRYLLDKPNELEIFNIAEFPDGIRTTHRVTYNSKDEMMTIYGLYPGGVNGESETVFVRK